MSDKTNKPVKSDVIGITNEITDVLAHYPHLNLICCKVYYKTSDTDDKHHQIRINL